MTSLWSCGPHRPGSFSGPAAAARLWLAGAATLAVAAPPAHAQDRAAAPAASRIESVTLYPGSATVERVARVATGTRQLVFSCLPAALDVQSLAVSADAPVRVGELAVREAAIEAEPGCAVATVAPRIRELEDRKALLTAEHEALGLVTGYLKGVGSTDGAAGPRATPDPRAIAATADALRRSAQDALTRQHQIRRQQEDLDRELAPLLALRERERTGRTRVLSVAVTLDAPREAELRLRYQIAGPGWSPAYRALLDTVSGAVRLERQALVAQATGEDWRDVALRLSTGQPRRGTAGPQPRPWRVGLVPPPPVVAPKALPAAAPAPAPMALARGDAAPTPSFDVSVFQGSYATEFAVPQRIDVPSGGDRVTLSLGSQPLPARLLTRTVPQQDPSAWLVAEVPSPEGVWPAGPLQLLRDGAYVGSDTLRAGGPGPLTLPFGRDEQVLVTSAGPREVSGSAGFAGTRAGRTTERTWMVENRHRTPVTLQLLEAIPVATHEDVHVETRFDPEPTGRRWQEQPGVVWWEQRLAAGQRLGVTSGHTLSWPREARLQESR